MLQKLRARIVLVLLLMAASVSSHAAFHLMEISEAYSNASGTVQFIELTMLGGGQNQLFGRTISSTQGASTNSFTFPNTNPPNAISGRKILIGTTGYAALSGVPPPDYTIPNGFIFTSNVTINFAGAAFLSAASIPTDGTLSINNAGVTATNSPTNNAGVSGTVVLPSQNTPPTAPSIISATTGNGTATIVFTPGANGGSAILDFTATCTLSGFPDGTGTTMASPVVISGLLNNNTYTCSIKARNAIGIGPASGTINVTSNAPASMPGAPTINNGSAGDGTATLDFTAPSSDGGAMITNYIATCGNAVSSGPSSPITVSGLSNGTTVACAVAATNSAGTGPQSAPVNVTPRTVPGAPIIGAASPANAAASIAFVAPASNGGSAITGFTATCNPGAVSASAAMSPVNVAGLTNGTTYTCSVTAANIAGSGAASAAVNVVPATVPGAPTIGATIPGDGRGAVTFTAPASNGGAAIISFTATCGGFSVTGLASPITITGLTNGMPVTCSVVATNSVGNSAASATASVTPSAIAPLTPVAVLARKTHGGAGIFDLPVDTTPGAVTAEPRIIGVAGHTIVFQFNQMIATTGTVTVAPVGSVSAVASGFDAVVTLTGVPDNQRVTVSLANVNGAGVNVAATIGFLIGDVNNTGSVNSSDISGVKARSGQTTTGLNFRFDVNATGAINSSDISVVKARSGLVLP